MRPTVGKTRPIVRDVDGKGKRPLFSPKQAVFSKQDVLVLGTMGTCEILFEEGESAHST